MTKIAILGFGVVGGGVARLITDNAKEVAAAGGDCVEIKYVLDLRDFPDSPFADRVIHDFDKIVSDPEVSVVIEVMGGSHPAYEYTVRALSAGKSVITSNKEVVARYGDEFLELAAQNGVSYRFEAAVGGGIPVISPIISCIRHNKVGEVRGILNGTTNYILTQMFEYGKSFDAALEDAQKKGYAESNPDADILGIDACRKIAILTALVTGKLLPTDKIHTEGIVNIRSQDVEFAASRGATIKLVGRCVMNGDEPVVAVAPFIIDKSQPLSTVSGVYNAVEIVAEPLGNVMFYGQGAGAGATASAVVGDLVQTMRMGEGMQPCFEKSVASAPFGDYCCRNYIAAPMSDAEKYKNLFSAEIFERGDEAVIITDPISEAELDGRLYSAGLTPLSRIRLL